MTLAAHGAVPSHFASFVLDAPTGLTRQRTDDVAAPEAFSFEMTDSRGEARHRATQGCFDVTFQL